MPIPSDTSAEAAAVQLELLRAKSPDERLMTAIRMSEDMAAASKRAIRRLHPEFNEEQVGVKFVELHYGQELADGLRQYLECRKHG